MAKAQTSYTDTARVFLAFLVVLLAFSILLLFVNYKDNILSSAQQFYLFLSATVVGMGLLITLVYLVNNQKVAKGKSPKKK